MGWLTEGWLQQATKHPVAIYTDGSYLHKRGRCGGWAALVVDHGDITELSGSEHITTSQRMELLAAIKGLQSIANRSIVNVFTDSQYVKQGISSWIHAWKRREWKTLQGKPIANKDLWVMLDEQAERHIVSWHWLHGHDGDAFNERCDVLAREAAECRWMQIGGLSGEDGQKIPWGD